VTYIDKKFKRVSAESAYLTPDVLARKNLTVAIHATVTKILFDTTSTRPRAIGVEFGRKEGGERFVAYAKKEVVVSYVYFPCSLSVIFHNFNAGEAQFIHHTSVPAPSIYPSS
jgi:hypothetical protein